MTARVEILVLDARNALYRAASAFQELSTEIDGEEVQTGAIYGFVRVLLATWQEFGGSVVVAWEGGATMRRALYPEYKRRRSPSGPDQVEFFNSLRRQELETKRLLQIIGVRQFHADGWEADDVIAAICGRFPDHRIGILSGDRDLLQLVTERHQLIRPLQKGKVVVETPESIRAEWGVAPAQILDLKALAGDTGDNIPGAPGVGPVTASKLIAEHGGWEETLKWAKNNEPSKKWHHSLLANEDKVRMSAELVRLNPKVILIPIPPTPEPKRLLGEFSRLGFQSLLRGENLVAIKAMASMT